MTLSDADGLPLNMGTLFDEAVPASHAAYYEMLDSLSEHQHRARHNRWLLYGLMSDAGFYSSSSWSNTLFGNVFFFFWVLE